MKIISSLFFMCAFIVNVAAQSTPLASENDSVSYSLGVVLGTSIQSAGVDNLNEKVFMQGISDATSGKPTSITVEQANIFLNQYIGTLNARKAETNLAEGQKFLAENAKKEGIVNLPSGLQYKVINEGTGASPVDTSFVTVHYTGKLLDGKVFDSSVERGEPVQFPVNGVIPGWTEALKLMKPGAKWTLFIPSELAYGERGNRGIDPNSVLIFDVELLKVE